MAEGRQQHEWEMQSVLMAHISMQLGDREARPINYMPEHLIEPEDRAQKTASETISMTEAIALLKRDQ